ncbi:MAG: FISUMP domain-containing protein, partial [Bacteroidales bacterium]|nr:FISUMP domain-containing protein [Bacteroidales bacterium]
SKNSNVTITESTVTSSSSKVVVTNGTKPGDYVLTMQTVNNCDSVINLHVNRYTVPRDTVYGDTLQLSALTSTTVTSHGHTFVNITAAGVYFENDTLIKTNGCDSIVTVILTIEDNGICVLNVSVETVTDEVCGGDGSISLLSVGGIGLVQYSMDNGISWYDETIFKNLSAGKYTIKAKDAANCQSATTVIVAPAPRPMISVTCPADIRDTLAYGDCVMNVYPDRIGTPTYIHSFDWPMAISNNIPEDYLFQDGENVITWVFTDKCGNSGSCEQKVTIVFPQCPDAVDCEGNVYKGVRIGCDCWTQRNLESTQYSAGGTCVGDIPCVYEYESSMYPNVAENVATFGKLYCFEAAIGDSSDNGNGHIQGICPEGWYLPTPEKYADLFALGAEALRSPNYWVSGGGNNSTEFTWLPAGMWNGSVNRFEGLMSEGYFWATEDTGSKAKAKVIHISYACDEVMKIESSTGNGYSVRCIKDN